MFLVSRVLLALPTRDHGPKSHVGVPGWELEQRASLGTVLGGDGTGGSIACKDDPVTVYKRVKPHLHVEQKPPLDPAAT